MGEVSAEIKLQSIDRFIKRKHGSYRRLTIQESNILNQYISDMTLAIESQWPILTGYSIVRWTWRNESIVGDTKFYLENKAWYADWVHPKGVKRSNWRWLGRALWQDLLPEVFNEFKTGLIADLKKEIERTERSREDRQDTGPIFFLDGNGAV
jgi:hypothetical protein